MSDNVVKSGVGDVLSSVKRLVSEEVREDSEFIFIPNAPGRKPGRLVLTESLRVSEPEASKPLKLVPELGAKEVATEKAANKSEPMRLEPSNIVKPAEPAPSPDKNEDGKTTSNEGEISDIDGKRDLAGSLSAKIEALEAAIARTEDQWEPDGESDDAYSGTPTKAVDWPDAPEAQKPEGEDQTPFIFTRSSDAASQPVSGPVALNEDALSELVAQIVRKELQGALGEGITRNIRKMVRREINKALAEQNAK